MALNISIHEKHFNGIPPIKEMTLACGKDSFPMPNSLSDEIIRHDLDEDTGRFLIYIVSKTLVEGKTSFVLPAKKQIKHQKHINVLILLVLHQ